jgi:menaquinone-dependent protoporphyrinogen oxidase
MAKRILVAYASGSGSTAEVAEFVGQALDAKDVTVDVRPAHELSDIEAYSAVVLGSSVRLGRWLPEAVRFVERHHERLAQIPVAYFTTCLTMRDDTGDNRRVVLGYLQPVLRLSPEIRPVGLGLFAGSLSPGLQAISPGPGPYGDFRDWEAIRAWALEIRPALIAGEVGEATAEERGEVVLSSAALPGADRSKADRRRTARQAARLSGAALHGADMRQVDLTRVDLSLTDLSEAGLGWARLNEANLSRADLSRANLIGAELRGANLNGSDLQQAILNGANLAGAQLQGADLRQADLNWAVLTGASLIRAKLQGAGLGWADLSEADLNEAELDKARYNEYTKWPEGFSAEDAGCILVLSPH